jgi:hypothetical protein
MILFPPVGNGNRDHSWPAKRTFGGFARLNGDFFNDIDPKRSCDNPHRGDALRTSRTAAVAAIFFIPHVVPVARRLVIEHRIDQSVAHRNAHDGECQHGRRRATILSGRLQLLPIFSGERDYEGGRAGCKRAARRGV